MKDNADDIIRRLWTTLGSKVSLSFTSVTFTDGSAPEANRCKENVARWTNEHPEDQRLHGWLALGDPGLLLQKHWMVRQQSGTIINITPLSSPTPMLVHPGSLEEFEEMPEEIHLVHYQHLRGLT